MVDKIKDKLQNYKSRKFWTLVGLFIASFILAFTSTTLLGSAVILFNFWTALAGVFFGADTYAKYVHAKGNGGVLPDNKWVSKKFTVLIALLAAGFALALAKPLFIGTASVLFTFWLAMVTLYFGSNVVEKKLTDYLLGLKEKITETLAKKKE